ncbi:hypothetical protein BDA96_03G309100 [Sorghum bicolor]|uniref:Uncharacterized protein n=1 Tax=Sorghum bicolor TaxID=4558 RepID=A0A921UP15_SORBI|nr:hypothetical protein BDA96_03G309100 [Sorghum bicolor]
MWCPFCSATESPLRPLANRPAPFTPRRAPLRSRAPPRLHRPPPPRRAGLRIQASRRLASEPRRVPLPSWVPPRRPRRCRLTSRPVPPPPRGSRRESDPGGPLPPQALSAVGVVACFGSLTSALLCPSASRSAPPRLVADLLSSCLDLGHRPQIQDMEDYPAIGVTYFGEFDDNKSSCRKLLDRA